MIYRRERPRCRKTLISLCKEYNCSLQELLDQELLDHPRICLTDNLKVQARKMISEGKFISAKELKDFEHRNLLHRAVRLIKNV